MGTTRPTPEQAAAVHRFAMAYGHGRAWKSALSAFWLRGRYDMRGISPDDAALLQTVRNQFGPTWLAKVTLAALRRWEESK